MQRLRRRTMTVNGQNAEILSSAGQALSAARDASSERVVLILTYPPSFDRNGQPGINLIWNDGRKAEECSEELPRCMFVLFNHWNVDLTFHRTENART